MADGDLPTVTATPVPQDESSQGTLLPAADASGTNVESKKMMADGNSTEVDVSGKKKRNSKAKAEPPKPQVIREHCDHLYTLQSFGSLPCTLRAASVSERDIRMLYLKSVVAAFFMKMKRSDPAHVNHRP